MNSAKIMIVEDNSMVAEDLRGSLQDQNYEITSVVISGEDAIIHAEQEAPDIILMDISLRGNMDGIEAGREISKRFHIPLIFLTGLSEHDIVKRAWEIEPCGYLIKPFNDRKLHTTIEMTLTQSRIKKEREKQMLRSSMPG